MTHFCKSTVSAIVLVLTAVPATAQIDEAEVSAEEALENDRMEEIIVTGTKGFKSIQKTETSVAVITETAINEQALFDVRDALLRVANVSTLGGDALNNLSIRGIQLTGVGFTGTGSTANVYVDGAPGSFNANQGASNLWDVAQVEILRGPQSTVQGRNALAGALIINTADPEYDFGVRTRAIVGTENTYQFSGMATGPIVTDQLAFRVAADYREQDFGVSNALSGGRALFNEALTLRGKLLFEPDTIEGLRVELIASHVDTEFAEFGTVNGPVEFGEPGFDDFDPFGDETFNENARLEFNKTTRGILDIQYDLTENWRLFALGTIEDVNRDTVFGEAGSSESRDRTYSSELRFSFDFDGLAGWFGGYYFNSDTASDTVFNTPLSIIGLPVDPPDSFISIFAQQGETTENYALFGEVTYELNEKWSINVGARYDWENFETVGLAGDIEITPETCTVAPFVPGIGGLPCALIIPVSNEPPQAASFNAFLPRGAITYSIDDLRSVSFVVARGYRAGGSFLFGAPGQAPEVREFGPEYITNYELAFRSQWLDQTLTVNANAFFSRWTEQQVSIPDPSGLPFSALTSNAGTSELYGLELDVVYQPRDNVSVFTSLGLLSTEFTDFPFAPNSPDPAFQNLAGNRFTAAPTFNLSAGFVYEHTSGFFVNANGSYATRQFSDVTNLAINESEDYFLMNARVGYRNDLYEIALYANNLFDQRVITRQGVQTFNVGSNAIEPNSPPFFVVNDPQVIGVALTFGF